MEEGVQVVIQGSLDSARDDAIGGWVLSANQNSDILAILVDQENPRIRLCQHIRPNDPKAKGFYFDGIGPETFLRLLLGAAWIVAVELGEDYTSEKLERDGDVDPRLLSAINSTLLDKGNAIDVASFFRSSAMDCIASYVGAVATPDILISRLEKTIGFEPWKLCLAEPVPENTDTSTSYFEIPVGTISRDTSTIVGKMGHLFLFEGTNFLLNQYNETGSQRKHFKRWQSTLKRRKSIADKFSAQFIQVIIPEKTTVLKDLFPLPIDAPTYSLRHIRTYTSNLDYVFDMLPDILAHSNLPGFYRKTDSHFSCRGCETVANMILARLRLEPFPPVVMGGTRIFRGDLGRRFPGLVETLDIPNEALLSTHKPIEIRRYLPPSGGHEGINVVWQNPNAPIDKTVVAFSNSFFDVGDYPHQISWWLARYFKEFHFVWSRNVDEKYIEAVGPDILIAQTIERFLPMIPES